MSAVMILILINVVVFLMQKSNPGVTDQFVLSAPAVRNGEIYTMITCMFLHGSFFHIFFNMWMLHMFGNLLESRMGKTSFFLLYFISGIVGSVLYVLINWNSPIGCIGASGAVMGLAIATAMFYPNMQIMLLFPPIPMKMKTFAVVFVLLEIFLESTKVDRGSFMGNVAHVAHLGGVLGGYLYLKIFFSREIQWDFLPKIGGGGGGEHFTSKPPPGWNVVSGKGEAVSQRELDRLLDKISATGINSLTPEEEDTLRRARDQMKRG
jgi:membrane associated rhomboid family serine protease